MKPIYFSSLLFACILSTYSCKRGVNNGNNATTPADTISETPVKTDVSFWLTTGDRSALLQKQNVAINFSEAANAGITVDVNDKQTYQTVDGFGYTLTGGSAMLINKLDETKKDALLKELFSSDEHAIGVNYLRLSVGGSDLSSEPFTYNEIPSGQTDINLEKFSIEREMADMIPVLKKIVAISPGIKIMGSPWTAPTWMKDNKSFKGGSLLPQYYKVYARYFVKYIEAMKAQGITIDAITVQNEPLHPGNNPSMYMTAADQATFIKTALGPAFKNAGIKTKIIIYDHNADRPDYPISILDDAEAKKYVDGSAFHLYGGNIAALSKVHEAHPDKNLYFTEQWVGGPGNFPEDLKWHVSTLIVGATRNWSRNVLEWNLAADQNYDPHTDDGGCTTCLGAITISPEISRNVAYYIIGHASKFVKSGSVRISSTQNNTIQNVAFKTPDGNKVLIAVNTGGSNQSFSIKYDGKSATASLAAGAVGTFVW